MDDYQVINRLQLDSLLDFHFDGIVVPVGHLWVQFVEEDFALEGVEVHHDHFVVVARNQDLVGLSPVVVVSFQVRGVVSIQKGADALQVFVALLRHQDVLVCRLLEQGHRSVFERRSLSLRHVWSLVLLHCQFRLRKVLSGDVVCV